MVTLTGGTQNFAALNAGTVTNAANVLDGQGNILMPGGDIEAMEAAVTLAGRTVDQFGLIDGSTSVTLNGRIDLLADYGTRAVTVNGVTNFYPFSSGTVEFGGSSVTQILPELAQQRDDHRHAAGPFLAGQRAGSDHRDGSGRAAAGALGAGTLGRSA